MQDIGSEFKRVSLLSDKFYNGHITDKKPDSHIREGTPPQDKYYLATVFAFFNGIAALIPITFFLTANDYWMYKFRDTSSETYDLNNKTTLQSMFASMMSIATSIPGVISVILTAFFADKIDMRKRFLITLGGNSILFIIFTSMVKINTDSWQVLFCALALTVLATISLFQPLYGMTSMAFFSRFPAKFMKINMYGVAVGGIFGSLLQLVCLSIANDSITIAMIYFSLGSLVMCFTFFLAYIKDYSPVIDFYANHAVHKEKKKVTLKMAFDAIKSIWPLILMQIIHVTTAGAGHPNISVLIVSEGYEKDGDNLWYDKYFVVTITFLSYDIFQFIGRFFAHPFITRKNWWMFLLLNIGKSFILGPLYLMCNAQPRNLPIWFPHDYQYMIIHALNSFLMGAMLSIQALSVPNFAGDKTEVAYMMLAGLTVLSITVISPINPLFVQLLKT